MNTFFSSILAAALTACLGASSAMALTTINFSTLVTSGENALDGSPNPAFNGATGSGSITYDETLLQTDFFDADLTFSLTMFGQNFSTTDDELGSAYYDSVFGDLFFSVNEAALLNPVAIVFAGVEGFAFSGPITPLLGGGNQINVHVFAGDGTCNAVGCALTPIPVPASAPLLLAAVGFVGWRGRRSA